MDASQHALDNLADPPSAGGRGCWADLFELSHFRGSRRRIFGPADLRSIRSRFAAWGIGIDSLVVGPAAQVQVYAAQPCGATISFGPDAQVEDLLALGIGDDLDSVRIEKIPVIGQK
jgi:hypothetical protein